MLRTIERSAEKGEIKETRVIRVRKVKKDKMELLLTKVIKEKRVIKARKDKRD